jgi:FixJ family two-component response regulator/DNA-binding CsgD family transcriptional regulator
MVPDGEAKPRIIFVDDDVHLLDALRRTLRDFNERWCTEFFDRPAAALEFCRLQPPAVAVLDVRMPEISGFDLSERIASLCPDTIIVILSGAMDFELAVSFINVGRIFRFLVKPCPQAVLIDALQAALAERDRRLVTAGTQQTALDLLNWGLVVLGDMDEVLLTNGRAGMWLSGGFGLRVDSTGVCSAERKSDVERLKESLQRVRATGDTTALTVYGEEGRLLRVTIRRYSEQGLGDRPAVYLFLVDPTQWHAPEPQLLMGMFGLTLSEARLTAALVDGLSLEEAAQLCHLTLNSARTYLKTIFAKVGVSRQSELLRTILLSVAK